MNNKRSVFSGLFWKFNERILAQGVSFIVSIVLARLLMPEDYGVVAMVNVFITIADVFVVSGFSTALIQKIDANKTDFSTILYCSLLVSILIYGVLFVAAPFIARFYNEPILCNVIRIFSLRMPLAAYNSVQHAYVSRHMLFKKFFFSTLIGTLISGVVGIVMAYMGFGVWSLIAQYMTNSIIDIIVLSFTIEWKPQLLFSFESAKILMNYGWKVLIADLIGTVYNQMRSLIIGKFYSSADLAYYNRGKKFPELITINVDGTISSVLFPAMSNFSNDKTKIRDIVRRSMRITSFVVFPLMLGMATVAKSLVIVLLTDKWIKAVPYLQIVCISGAINSVCNTNLQAIKAIGRSDIVLKLEFIKKPIGLLMVILSVRYGVMAIAATLLIYGVYAALVNMAPNKKLIDYGIPQQISDLLPATVLSLLMCFVVFLVGNISLPIVVKLILQIVIGSAFYIIVAVITKMDAASYIISYLKELSHK